MTKRIKVPYRRNILPALKARSYSQTPRSLEAVTTRKISLLTTDVNTRQLIRVSRNTMALKNLQIPLKVLAKMSNVMWNLVLACEEEAKKLVGSVQTTKSVRL